MERPASIIWGMSKSWQIRGFDGSDEIYAGTAPARFSEEQIVELLARLHCRHLSEDEIIRGTEASDGPKQTSFMVRPNNGGKRPGYMTTGNPHYVAWYESNV